MTQKKETMPTLRDDLKNGGYNGNIYFHPDIIQSFAYEIIGLSPERQGPDFPIIAGIKKYDRKNGSPLSDSSRGEDISLTMCLNDERADDELVKKIRDYSS